VLRGIAAAALRQQRHDPLPGAGGPPPCTGPPASSTDHQGAAATNVSRPAMAGKLRPGPGRPAAATNVSRPAMAGKLRTLQGRVLALRVIPSCAICGHLRDLRFQLRFPRFTFHPSSLILLSALRSPLSAFHVGRWAFDVKRSSPSLSLS
jgi:hypothetical protein